MASITPNATSQITAFVTGLTVSDIPPPIRDAATSLIVDTLGCLRGGALTPLAARIKTVSSMFGGPGKASVVGCTKLVGTTQALYVNAQLSNLLDMDETFPIGAHFGVGAVCGAIAALESREKENSDGCGADLLVGVIAGYEIAARVACAIGPIMKVEDGKVVDYAQIWGVAAPVVIAACVAYAKTLGPDVVSAATLEQALGIAVSNIPLPIGNRWSDSVAVADCKYCDAGWCAVTGMHGVVSALAGLTGFEAIFDGEVGLAQACGTQMPRPESLIEQLGKLWYLADITFKPWPTCRWIHAPQTALRRLLEKHKPALEDITEVIIYTNPVADCALFRNPSPSTFTGYSFSYINAIAMMLLGVPPGPKWLDLETANSEAAKKLRDIVKIESLEGAGSFAQTMVRNQIRTMPGAVTVKTAQGHSWSERTEYSDGDPWTPETRYDWEKVVAKFRKLTGGASDAEKLLEWMSELEYVATIEPLSSFIRNSGLAT